MNQRKFTQILVVVMVCLLATPIATFISDFQSITTIEYELSRIEGYAWSIRFVCLILSMYFIFDKDEK